METDPRTLADGDLADALARLESEEHAVSARRKRLHDRIDYLQGFGNADGTPATPVQLAALDDQEREISATRRGLHHDIDDLRAEQRRRSSIR